MLKVFALLTLLASTAVQAQTTLQSDLPLKYLEQVHADSEARPLVIFLHGYGSNEADLIGMKFQLPAQYNYLSVQAPLSLGEGRFQWFRKKGEGAYNGETDDLKVSGQKLRDFIAQAAQKYHTTPSKVYLIGFSQGAMMTYEVGLRPPIAPEIDALFGVPQPEAHHPEIDTGLHTLSVLEQSALYKQPLTVRWACLLHDLGKGLTPEEQWPRHIAHEHTGLKLIKTVNERFKAPKDCQELALLVGKYHTHGHRALELKASTLLDLLQSFDVYRRPQRFEEFIAACEMDARGRKGLEQRSYPQADYLRGAAKAAREVAVQPLLEKGFKGPELGEALKRERLKALKAYKENS